MKDTNSTQRKLRYLMLTGIDGLGPVGQHFLLQRIGGINACFDMDEKDLLILFQAEKENRLARSLIRERTSERSAERAYSILEECSRKSIEIITAEDREYPLRFEGIAEIPVVLFAKGCLMINEFDSAAGIVGARRCTRQGKECAIEIASASANSGAAVISGMAKGIDSYAHTACIRTGGYTVAVLGSGADICYPKEHHSLYEAIADTGCILSQYPPGTEPRSYMFPVRNRIIAALSDELHVIDAGRGSGTCSTIEAAVKYQRRVHLAKLP